MQCSEALREELALAEVSCPLGYRRASTSYTDMLLSACAITRMEVRDVNVADCMVDAVGGMGGGFEERLGAGEKPRAWT